MGKLSGLAAGTEANRDQDFPVVGINRPTIEQELAVSGLWLLVSSFWFVVSS